MFWYICVKVGLMVKGLSLLHLTLELLRDMCCVDKGSLHESVRQWRGQLKCLQQRFTSNVGKNGQVGVFEIVRQTMAFLPLK